MNDFQELENELKKLRPMQPSAELSARIERAMAGAEPGGADNKIIRPAWFQINWISLGMAAAAAAVLLVVAHIDFKKPSKMAVAANTPAPNGPRPLPSSRFIPAGATQVVYDTRDEGLHFSGNSSVPVRRVRSRMQESWQWRNPATGASLRVSYPKEQVELIPISGQ